MKKTHIVFLSGVIAVSATGSAVGSSAPQTSGHGSFSAKAYPERNDDFAWENDIVAFRAYGPQTRRNGEKSFGYDIFLKYPGKGLVLEELYAVQTNPANWAKVDSLGKIDPAAAKDFENSFTYHIDHGKGMDCYAVGATLGCGATALLEDGRLVMPWTYETVEVIADTPDSLVFRLDFPPAVAGCDTVTEHRKIRLDKATHLNYSEVYYDGLSSERKIAAGFPLRDNPAPCARRCRGGVGDRQSSCGGFNSSSRQAVQILLGLRLGPHGYHVARGLGGISENRESEIKASCDSS